MRRNYNIVVLGCSCFGMGCAAQDPENTLILESSEGFGGEFVDSLRECSAIARPDGAAGNFYDELIQRGIMSEDSAKQGILHLPAVNVVLNRMALERKMHILFRTRLVDIRKTESGAAIQAVCNARIMTFECRKVIDTRSDDFGKIQAIDPNAFCGLSANLYAPEVLGDSIGEMRIKRGYLPKEAYMTMKVEKPSQLDRENLLTAFAGRPNEWKNARLLQVASMRPVLCERIRRKTENGWFIPGCGFGNPVEAWVAGLAEKEVCL